MISLLFKGDFFLCSIRPEWQTSSDIFKIICYRYKYTKFSRDPKTGGRIHDELERIRGSQHNPLPGRTGGDGGCGHGAGGDRTAVAGAAEAA